MNFNNVISTAYRMLAVGFLIGIFAIAISYAGLVVFFVVSNSWGTPLVLSPSQTRVLSFQPQVATLVLNINKQKAELQTALLTKQNILGQLVQIDTMAIKIEETVKVERKRAQYSYSAIDKLVASKAQNIDESKKTLTTINGLLGNIDAELKAGLITSDQAAQRRMSIQSANNSFTDLNIASTQMSLQATQLNDFSATLGGLNKSLLALAPTKQLMELDALKSQLKLQLNISERNLDIVKKAMAADSRILQVAMDSPYYRALWAPTPVLFVPYENINYIVPGQAVYDCRLQIIICRKVGTVGKLYDAEEYAKHPLFRTDLKGKLATVNFTDKQAANSSILFLGSKPLFI